MTRELFDSTAKDMGMDIEYHEKYKMYASAETQKAWRIWNLALESKTAVAEPEEKIETTVKNIFAGHLYFNWGQNYCGFGQLSITRNEDGTVTCMNENMSRRWVRRALHSAIDVLVDAAVLQDDKG